MNTSVSKFTKEQKPINVKHLPNIITALRITGSISLLFCNTNGWMFWTIYVLCGISDMVDGWLARRLHAESKSVSILDSIADLSFVACCAISLLPFLQIPSWLWIWAGIIVTTIATFAEIQEGQFLSITRYLPANIYHDLRFFRNLFKFTDKST